MTAEEIQHMIDNPGIWIVTDENHPGAEVPVCSIAGRLYSMQLDCALDPKGFLPSARLAAGPLRA